MMQCNVYVHFSNWYVFTFIYLFIFYLYVYLFICCVRLTFRSSLHNCNVSPAMYSSNFARRSLSHLTRQLLIFRKFIYWNTLAQHTRQSLAISDDAPTRFKIRAGTQYSRGKHGSLGSIYQHFAISRDNFNATHPAPEISEFNG